VQELKAKMQQKDAIEDEITAISEYLEGQGVPGLHGGLTDREGFPRADVDIHTVRTKRHRLACLNTDHQALMAVIEAGLKQHLAGAGPVESNPSGSGNSLKRAAPQTAEEEAPAKAVALIAEVTEASPAALAGFQVDDRVVAFGSAVHPAGLQAIAGIVRSSVGTSVRVRVVRGPEDKVVVLELAPREWAGQGLIGMRLMPVTE
jgi:26S proteasome regulatory subunit N4